MLILKTLTRVRQRHGFEIAEAIHQNSGEVFLVEEGSLYPALQRALIKGWVSAEWGRTADNRRARYYRISASGRRHLEDAEASYERVSRAIVRILRPSAAGA